MLRNSQAKSDADSPVKTEYEVRQLATAAYEKLLQIIPGIMNGIKSREYFIEQVVLTAYQETKFDNSKVGSAGEIGLMQIKPNTAKDIEDRILKYKENKALNDPYYNVLLGSGYLAYQITRYSNGENAAWDYGVQAYQKGSFNKLDYPSAYLLKHYALSEELYAGKTNPFAAKLQFYASKLSKTGGDITYFNRNRMEWP